MLNNKKFKIGATIFTVLVLVAFLLIPFLFSSPNSEFIPKDRNLFSLIYYIVCFCISLACLYILVFKHKKINIWALLAFISVLISIVGFLIIATSENIKSALVGNRICYFGNVFLLPFMFMTLANICNIKVSKFCEGVLFTLALIMFIFSFSQGYYDLFYTSQTFEIINGFPKIIKEYGPLHTVYLVYIILVTVLIIGLVAYTLIKNKMKCNICIILISAILFVNVILWLIEKFLPYTVEYTSGAFVLTEIALLFIFRRLEHEGFLNQYIVTVSIQNDANKKEKMQITIDDIKGNYFVTNNSENSSLVLNEDFLRNKLDKYFDEVKLTNREKDVVYLLIRGYKRHEIATTLYISDETVKTHVKHIFHKLKISSHIELKEKAAEKLKK